MVILCKVVSGARSAERIGLARHVDFLVSLLITGVLYFHLRWEVPMLVIVTWSVIFQVTVCRVRRALAVGWYEPFIWPVVVVGGICRRIRRRPQVHRRKDVEANHGASYCLPRMVFLSSAPITD